MAGMTQGALQTGTVVSGGEAIKTYLYDFTEVSFSIGDGGAPDTLAATKINTAGIAGETQYTLASGTVTQKICAVDFALAQRFDVGDIVTLTSISERAGGAVNGALLIRYMAIVSEPKSSASFLARLTSGHATIAGLYAWTGVSVQGSGSLLGKSLAVNLFELNAVRSSENYANVLTLNGTSYAGSSNWGHGQDTTAISKLPLPTGSAGTGTIVQMNRGTISATLTTTTAGSFVIGIVYKIITVGSTNFTLIGASANTVGISFTATGIGTGTGTAGFYGAHYWFYSVAPVTCV